VLNKTFSCESEFIKDILIDIPSRRIHGELSTNIALISAKIFKKSPREIADIILKNLEISKQFKSLPILKSEIAGAGFVNFFLNSEFYKKVLIEINEMKNHYGSSGLGKKKKVLIEFVSANPTGPMHIGNARLGALGDCLANILKFSGFEVYKEFYVNDSGNQIKKFGESLAARYIQIFDPSFKFPEDGYQGEDIIEHAQKFSEIYGNKMLNKKNLEDKLIEFALPKNIEEIKKDLINYRIFYDNWFYESELYKNDKINAIISKFKELGVVYEKENTLWFKVNSDYKNSKDEVLVRSNGIPTYFASDIAYHANKFLTRKFDICINIWGADHHGHVGRMEYAVSLLGIGKKKLKIMIVQLVRLIRNGETERMSKRSGKSETLKSFLETVGVDCARFIFNMQNFDSKMDFDLDLALKNDFSNPVYYVQYAHARAFKIIKNKETENFDYNNLNIQLLNSEEEQDLIFALACFPKEVTECAQTYDSTKITRYLINLSSLFHKFYNFKRVKCENYEISICRLFLCIQTVQTLKNALNLLGVSAPEDM
jgi:arginyl-tRNA synthetase